MKKKSNLEIVKHARKTSTETIFVYYTYKAGLNTLYKNASVEDVEYGAENITVIATVDAKIRGMLSAYDGGEVR